MFFFKILKNYVAKNDSGTILQLEGLRQILKFQVNLKKEALIGDLSPPFQKFKVKNTKVHL